MAEPWDITSDTELKTAVRSETQYDTGKLSDTDLDNLIESAKRVLALKANVTTFYDDRGIATALLGVVCAKSKGAVENSPVVTKNLGASDVTFRASDGSSLQLGQYEEMTQLGLSNAETTDAGVQGIEMTRDWLNDSDY